jgi:hypothetical protein
MRVITWNMGLATGGTHARRIHDQAWHHLLGLGPDIAFVQEALPPSWVRSEGSFIQGAFSSWGSAIFSPRYPLERYRLPAGSNLKELGSYVALAIASLPDGTDALVASVHARAESATAAQLIGLEPEETTRPGLTAPNVNDAIAAGLRNLEAERFIYGGDWNTARRQRSERTSAIGRQFFERVRGWGWRDCVWDVLEDEVQTWFGPRGGLKQDDYIFCHPAFEQATESQPWASAAAATQLRLSDHAPLIVDFTMEPIAMTNLSSATSADPPDSSQ